VNRLVDMPEKMLHLLHDILRQGEGRFSKRTRGKEFAALTDSEAERIEQLYRNTLGKLETPVGPVG
jgi:hypothetical protein